MRILGTHQDCAPLVLRLLFVLGNVTARSAGPRITLVFDVGGRTLFPSLLRRFWFRDRQLAQVREQEAMLLDPRAQGGPQSPEEEEGKSFSSRGRELERECEDVLMKLARLVANLAISPAVGTLIASDPGFVEPLLLILETKRLDQSAELLLHAVAGVSNLFFYDAPSSLLFQEQSQQVLGRAFCRLLQKSDREAALIETARALGNLSRHAGSLPALVEAGVDEVLARHLEDGRGPQSRDLAYYICGVLVNLASDMDCAARLVRRFRAVPLLAGALQRAALDGDRELQQCIMKVLLNLTMAEEVRRRPRWQTAEILLVREALDATADARGTLNHNGPNMRGLADMEDCVAELSMELDGRLSLLAAWDDDDDDDQPETSGLSSEEEPPGGLLGSMPDDIQEAARGEDGPLNLRLEAEEAFSASTRTPELA